MAMVNALTVDVEEWYMSPTLASCAPPENWERMESRVVPQTRRVLELLEHFGVRATFFVVGLVAERHPDLVREIQAAGHEIGSHGHSHVLAYRQDPATFAQELDRSLALLHEITGRKVLGHRACAYSVTRKSMWVLDILASRGLCYDSSVVPFSTFQSGMPGAPRFAYRYQGAEEGALWEFPPSTFRLAGNVLPLVGGFYLRAMPFELFRWGMKQVNREGHPAVVGFHPWELDPGQPVLPAPWLKRTIRYWNLSGSEKRWKRLLADFSFAPMAEVFGEHLQTG